MQFAANDAVQLADAAELVKPWVDGIDLNCGWSVSILYSSLRLYDPEMLIIIFSDFLHDATQSTKMGLQRRNRMRTPQETGIGARLDKSDKTARRVGFPCFCEDTGR